VTGLEWMLSTTLFMLYLVALFTVCSLTFRKGHVALGILGIFLPLLWLIGAVLPAKEGSRYDIEQSIRYEQRISEYTR
jgi:hypothetical protein